MAFVAAVLLQLAADRLLHRERAASTSPDSASRLLAWMGAAGAVAVVALLLATSVTTPDRPAAQVDTAAATDVTDTTDPEAGPKVAFYGDAMATTLEAAATEYATSTGAVTVVPGVSSAGCGLDRDGTRVGPAGPEPVATQCADWEPTWAAQIAATDPDVVVLATGFTEVADHQFDPAGPWVAPGNADYDYRLYLLMTKAVEVLSSQGAKVIWVDMPPFDPSSGAAADPARVAAFNAVLAKLPTSADGPVSIGGLSAWIAANGGTAIYPTAGGFATTSADLIVKGYLGPEITAVTGGVAGGTSGG